MDLDSIVNATHSFNAFSQLDLSTLVDVSTADISSFYEKVKGLVFGYFDTVEKAIPEDSLPDESGGLLKSMFRADPIYTIFAPVRHYVAGVLTRDATARMYKYFKDIKEDLNTIVHPGAILFYSVLPDFDAFIPGLTHRGFTHSLLFAALTGVATYAGARLLKSEKAKAYGVIAGMIVASHVGVDMFIEGGDPVSTFIPLTEPQTTYIHNSNLVGHVFGILGLGYLAARYEIPRKIGNVVEAGLNLLRRKKSG